MMLVDQEQDLAFLQVAPHLGEKVQVLGWERTTNSGGLVSSAVYAVHLKASKTQATLG